jgi:pimeloyl-ACP methyl ester carboxylesterase
MPGEWGPREGSIELRDGRRLTYAEWGDPDGTPVLNCHGSPSSRLERHVEDPALYARWGVRLITPDRPGFGGSDIQPSRHLLDWPEDVAELADALGIERFAVLGLSGGVAYALACAFRLPDRVSTVGVLGGSTPPDLAWPYPQRAPRRVRSALMAPWPGPLLLRGLYEPLCRRPALLPAYLSVRLSAPDRRVIARPGVRQVLTEMFAEGLRQGCRALAQDRSLLLRPWGFPLGRIRSRVHLWHGGRDWIVPAVSGRALAAVLPDCSPHFYRDEGHFLVFDHAEEVFAAVVS